MLTRRALLHRAAAAAAMSALPPGLARAAAPRGGPDKLISLGGSVAMTPGSVHDYRFWGNRDDVLATGTGWVKVWLSWAELQGGHPRPATIADSWAQLNAGVPGRPGTGLRVIDEQVRAANADGVRVILCLQSDSPAWATLLPGDPLVAPPPRRSPGQRLPRETGVDSPYGWLVAHLLARYRPGVGARLDGPRAEAVVTGQLPHGNPSGAVIAALEVWNEPNLLNWPAEAAAATTADMMRTADEWSARLRGPLVLGPGTADRDGHDEFAREVLAALGDWRPRGRVAWSHHNYRDMEKGTVTRLEAVRVALEEAAWPGRDIWLTEGGYDATPRGAPQTVVTPTERVRQAAAVSDGYLRATEFSKAARREGRIGSLPVFAQHCVHDQGVASNTFKSGLRDDFRFQPPAPGARRPAWYAWRDLG